MIEPPRPRTGGLCTCGHNQLSHEVEAAPACCHETCGCNAFDPLPPGKAIVPVPVAGDIRALIAEAKDTGAKRIVGLAERIEAQLDQLRTEIHAEQIRAKAKAEVAELEKRLAAARRAARQRPFKERASQHGTFQCPDCPKTCTTPQGLGSHRSRAHGYRRAGATA